MARFRVKYFGSNDVPVYLIKPILDEIDAELVIAQPKTDAEVAEAGRDADAIIMHGSAKTTKEKPSFYFKRQCWASTEAGEELVPTFLEHVGEDYLTIATDYPHSDAIDKFPDKTVGALSGNNKLSTETRRKILWDNPVRLYGLGM